MTNLSSFAFGSMFALKCIAIGGLVFMSGCEDSEKSPEAKTPPAGKMEAEEKNEAKAAQVPVETPPAGKMEAEKKKIAQELNSIIWILAQVKNHNDVRAVQEAARGLKSDYLNFEVIQDKTLVDIINRISSLITDVEIDAGDRELAEYVFEHESSQCMLDAFSGISCGASMNPATALVNLATSAAGGYMQYRSAMKKQRLELKKKKWELDKNMLLQVNELENELNERISYLTNRYNFPDDWRIGSNDAMELSTILKWPNKRKSLHELRLEGNEKKFSYMPQYWLQRGLMEFAVYGEMKKSEESDNMPSEEPDNMPSEELDNMLLQAQNSINRYIAEYENINRKSDDLVLAASAMIGIKSEMFMRKQNSSLNDGKIESPVLQTLENQLIKDVKYYIALIEKHQDRSRLEETWKNDYVIYAALKMIRDEELAAKKLSELINRLQQTASLHAPVKLSPKHITPYQKFKEPLNVCISELNALMQNKEMDIEVYKDLVDSQYVASQKKLVLFGKLTPDELKVRLEKELQGVQLVMDDKMFSKDELIVQLPVSWFFYANPSFLLRGEGPAGNRVNLRCDIGRSNNSEGIEEYISLKNDNNHSISYNEGDKYLKIKFCISQWDDYYKKGELEIHINYPKHDHPIGLIFRNPASTRPSEVRFGKAENYTHENPVYLKSINLY